MLKDSVYLTDIGQILKKTNSTLEIKRAKRTYEVSLNSLSPSVFGKVQTGKSSLTQ